MLVLAIRNRHPFPGDGWTAGFNPAASSLLGMVEEIWTTYPHAPGVRHKGVDRNRFSVSDILWATSVTPSTDGVPTGNGGQYYRVRLEDRGAVRGVAARYLSCTATRLLTMVSASAPMANFSDNPHEQLPQGEPTWPSNAFLIQLSSTGRLYLRISGKLLSASGASSN